MGAVVATVMFLACEASRVPDSSGDEGSASEESNTGEPGCEDHEIVCGSGKAADCVDPSTSKLHCGGCYNLCLYNADCVDGACAPAYGPCSISSESLNNCTAICEDAGGTCDEEACGFHPGKVHATREECLQDSAALMQTCDEVFPYLMTDVECCCDFY